MSGNKDTNLVFDNLKPLGDIIVDGNQLFSDQDLTDVAEFMSVTDE